MTRALLTLTELDQRLISCCEAFHRAIDDDDEVTADAMRDTMDELLDLRAHLPQQRHA